MPSCPDGDDAKRLSRLDLITLLRKGTAEPPISSLPSAFKPNQLTSSPLPRLKNVETPKAALRLVEETARFRAAVREGVAQADRGELIDDDEVLHWLEQQERA